MCLKGNGLVPKRPCCRRICTHRWLVGKAMYRQGSYEEKNDCIGISWRYNPLVTDVEAYTWAVPQGSTEQGGGSIQTTVGPRVFEFKISFKKDELICPCSINVIGLP